MDKLGAAVGIVATYFGGNLVLNLGKMVLQIGLGTVATQAFGTVFSAMSLTVLKAIAGMTARFILFSAAIEAVQSLFRQFTPDETTLQFNNFTKSAVDGLKQVEEAAKKARGEVSTIGEKPKELPSEGFDLTLGLGNAIGFSLKTDDVIKKINELNSFTDKLGGTKTSGLTTAAEKKRADQQAALGDQAAAAQNLAAKASQPGEINTALKQVKDLDAQIQAIDAKRAGLQMQSNPDKLQIEALRKQRQELADKRENAATPILEQSTQIENAIAHSMLVAA